MLLKLQLLFPQKAAYLVFKSDLRLGTRFLPFIIKLISPVELLIFFLDLLKAHIYSIFLCIDLSLWKHTARYYKEKKRGMPHTYSQNIFLFLLLSTLKL